MLKYIAKRAASALFTLVIILSIVFVLMRQMPIDGYFDNIDKMDPVVIEAWLQKMGLKDPIHVQLKNFFLSLLKGDLGVSSRYSVGASIAGLIARKAPISMKMGLMSMALSLGLGIPLGGAMARSKSRLWDKFGTVFIVLINAVPAAVYYIFLQAYGSRALGIAMLFDEANPVSWILPVFSMSLGSIAYYAMWLRRYMLDEINKDYVKLARAKGVSNRAVTMRHVSQRLCADDPVHPLIAAVYGGRLDFIESLYPFPAWAACWWMPSAARTTPWCRRW